MTITGTWVNDVIDGEAVLRFPNTTTQMKALFDRGRLVTGTVTYDTGVRIECEYNSTVLCDVPKTLVFFFACKHYFKCELNDDGKVAKGTLYNESYKQSAVWNGKRLVRHLDKEKSRGIVIGESSFYEGELGNEDFSGFGTEYLTVGLIYYKYERTGKAFNGQIHRFCFHLDNQFQKTLCYSDGVLTSSNELHSNGVRIAFKRSEGKGHYEVRFVGHDIPGSIVVESAAWNFPDSSKGSYKDASVSLELSFAQQDMSFVVHRDSRQLTLVDFSRLIKRHTKEAIGNPVSVVLVKERSRVVSGPDALRTDRTNTFSNKANDDLEETTMKTPSSKKCDIGCSQCAELKKERKLLQEQLASLKSRISELESKSEATDSARASGGQSYFSGVLLNGLRQGLCEEFRHGELFEGFYSEDKKQGQGLLKTPEFEYLGTFENDCLHGQGTKTLVGRNKQLVGKFYKNLYVGDELVFGKCRYSGKVINDKMHGHGKMVFLNNFEFSGSFEDDTIVEDYPHNKLVNLLNGKELSVHFKFSNDLMSHLFTSEAGDVFNVDFEKGVVLKLK